jgi:mRNA interferase RelE/StbE
MGEQPLWQVGFSETAQKQFCKLDKPVQIHIQKVIRNRLMVLERPQTLGKPLKGNLRQFWRFRVGDYRIIADIMEQRRVIEIISIGHRREIYH